MILEALRNGATTITEVAEDTFAAEDLARARRAIESATKRVRPLLEELATEGAVVRRTLRNNPAGRTLYFIA